MPDPTKPPVDRAVLVAMGIQLILGKTEGQPYEVRKQATLIVGAMRGHKFKLEDAQDKGTEFFVPCSNCGQIVKATQAGTNIEGRAVENDCPAASWKRPA
jgi:hypothetical protein